LCHQKHDLDFQLKMHHKAFGGQATPEPACGAHSGDSTVKMETCHLWAEYYTSSSNCISEFFCIMDGMT